MTNAEKNRLKKISGLLHHTESFGAVDGPGLRFVFFLQGCPLRCLYCHNPDAAAEEPPGTGQKITAGAAAEKVLRLRNFLQGVTFSGGEPLLQPEFIRAVTLLLGESGFPAAIDTAGAPDLQRCKAAIDAAALLLLDMKAANDAAAVELTGRDLSAAFATLDYCERTGKPVWIRHVLVPGRTLAQTPLETLARRLRSYRCIEKTELLPFHKLGEPKWERLNRAYQLRETPAVTPEELAWARAVFRQAGGVV
ncbi:MAG: radical SAM protein [Oscillospiraceae bacterium]|jgi:pyruvate formate lyase activating enzyme|nr:radical SAM protein [Oscillospiraceae bacterium]